jgi:pyruvate ferredoxin oxidoreductase alpha subunit
VRAGVSRIRYMRPFPDVDIAGLARSQRAIGVLEKDISFGYEGTVATNVKSALSKTGITMPVLDFIAGLGGRSITRTDVRKAFADLERSRTGGEIEATQFVNMGVVL